MDSKLQKTLRASLDELSEYEAKLTQEVDELTHELDERARERDERTRERDQVRKTREGIVSLLSGNSDESEHRPDTASASEESSREDDQAPLQESAKPNGLPEGLSRKQVVLQIIPEFRGNPFEARNVREKYLKRYPQADSEYLPQNISSLLREMAGRGEKVKRVGRKGDKPTDPYLYQEIGHQEEGLTLEP